MIRAKLLLVSLSAGALALSAFSNTGSSGAPGVGPSADPSAEPTAAPAPREPATPMALYFGDADGDGLDDALVVSPEGRIALLHNEGKGEFLDITLPSGLAGVEGATCALFADFDGDGALDLFLGSSEKRIWRNLGGASFVAVDSGVEHDLVDLTASVGDVDGDGRLDLYAHTEAGELLYRNTGSLGFEAVRMPSVFDSASGASSPTTNADVPTVELDEAGAPIPPSRRRIGRWRRMRNAAANNPGTSALASTGGITSTSAGPLGLASQPTLICAGTIVDQGTGQCIEADSVPTIGSLYPLSNAFNVDSAGKVGIGTPTPIANLHVSSTGGTWVRVTGNNPAYSLESTNPLGRNWSLFAIDSDLHLRDATAGVNRFTISPTGNVGIGTTSAPAANLHVSSPGVTYVRTTGTNPSYYLENTAPSGRNWSLFAQGSDLHVRDATASANRLSISSVGDVGIGGAPSSTYKLRVERVGYGIAHTDPANGVEVSTYTNALGGWIGTKTNRDFHLFANDSAPLLTVRPNGTVSVKQTLEIRGGADIVERFESSCGVLEPGTVVAIDPEHPGKLACSSGAYDTKVAGVVSGAGGVQPGLCLSQDGMLDGDTPVAMNGRVYVKCTASNGAIRPGDRLTTADLAGHAMKVSDEQRSIGAVIGKAMSSLESGEGLVLVLVNLQ
jgi:hypothetical protein